ncbi:MAG: tetratricopeptide repeat protein, partial [Deltaproteobacteria bacterium]|nr:tetratricopeptide repeat protein [Deltaproteobacteria bacterium]
VVDVKFRIASTYYRYHHFAKAQEVYKELVVSYPSHRSATTSARIVLDIFNIRKDYDGLNATAEEFAQMPRLGDASFRAEMASLRGEVGFKKVENLEKQNKWKEAAESYLAVFKSHPNSELAEKALYNAVISFEKAGDSGKAVETSRQFIAKFPKSEYTKRLSLTAAKNAEKQYDFENAQKLYQAFHKKYPDDKEAKKALYNAAVFAELLEWNSVSLDLYAEYLKQKGIAADEKKAIAISQAKIYRKQSKWDKAANQYRDLIASARTVEEKMGLLTELARLYEKAQRLKDRQQTLEQMDRLSEAKKSAKWQGLSLLYLAEAKYRSVDTLHKKYEKVKLRFPPDFLVQELKRKQKLLAQLAKRYDEVVASGVPDWGVAALHDKSTVYADFVQAFRSLQLPKNVKEEEKVDLQKGLTKIDTEIVKPLETKSSEILKACVEKAAQFHVVNDYVAKCHEKFYRGQEEIRPTGILPQPSYWSTRWISKEVAHP